SSTYMDLSLAAGNYVEKYVDFALAATVVIGAGDAAPPLLSKISSEREHDGLMPPDPNCVEPCMERPESQNLDFTKTKLAFNWLVQYSRMADLQANIGGGVQQHHHSLGFAYSEVNVGYSSQLPPPNRYWIKDTAIRVDVDSGISITSKTDDANARRGMIHSTVLAANALEASLLEQMLDLPESSSTATRFAWANEKYQSGALSTLKYYLVTSSTNTPENATQIYYHDGTLTGGAYGGYETSSYTNANYKVILANDTLLGPGNKYGPGSISLGWETTLQRGSAYIAYKDDDSAVANIVRNFVRPTKGGGAGVAPTYPEDFDPAQAANLLKDKFEDKSKLHGIDLLTGELTYSAPADITVGNGGFPYELSFQRTFRAGETKSPGLSEGWTHNLDI
ncbi:MAG: hypothetical protein ACREJC_19095, partial [Tepidisphaeraceae bacterium]